MNHFDYRDGQLHCEAVSLNKIADSVGTPVYVYSTATLERHFKVFRDALQAHPAIGRPLIAFAVKANANVQVLRVLGDLGAGADTVSEGEIRRALAAGIPAERIVFSGVGKRGAELEFALETGVAEINIESEPELRLLADIAASKGIRPNVAIRVNPDVAAGGHAKISTGSTHNKFGVSLAEAERLYAFAAGEKSLHMVGLACHIGSQINDLEPLEQAFRKMRGLVERLRAAGRSVTRLDLGGGLGVPYFDQSPPPTPEAYAAMVAKVVAGLDVALAFEPGRVIAANAGVLLTRVIHRHDRPEGPRFLVVDAAMNDLLRPAMYDAWHDLRPVEAGRSDADWASFDVVGPVCETGDTFARGRSLPELDSGDLVVLMSAGAYGAAMASEYNGRPLVPEVLVKGDQFAVVRPRPSYEAMLAAESPVPW